MSVQLMLESIFLALIATVFSIIFAVPLAFLGARNLMRGSPIRMAIYTVVRGFFNIFRSIQELVFAIIFVTVVGIGPFAGMLALFVHSVASLGKLYSEQIESIDPGPDGGNHCDGRDAACRPILYAVAPQVVPPFLAFTIYRWDINVRTSIVVGFVGGGGIGLALFQYQQLDPVASRRHRRLPDGHRRLGARCPQRPRPREAHLKPSHSVPIASERAVYVGVAAGYRATCLCAEEAGKGKSGILRAHEIALRVVWFAACARRAAFPCRAGRGVAGVRPYPHAIAPTPLPKLTARAALVQENTSEQNALSEGSRRRQSPRRARSNC